MDVELLPIGEVASRSGMAPSALRYYDERGLVSPSQRDSGRRMYGADELRRLAFIKVAQRLGLPLSTAAAVLDAPGPHWRQTVRQQIVELDQVIAQAQAAIAASVGVNQPNVMPPMMIAGVSSAGSAATKVRPSVLQQNA